MLSGTMRTFAGLGVVDPGRALEFVILFEEVGVGPNEVGGRHVLDGEEFLFYRSQHFMGGN